MERIDKIIGTQTEYSRKDIKKIILRKRVRLNGELVLKSDIKVDENKDMITIDGNYELVDFEKETWFVLVNVGVKSQIPRFAITFKTPSTTCFW